MNNYNNKIQEISKNKLQYLLNNSNSLKEILEKLNYSNMGSGNYKNLNKRITEDNLDLTKFQENRKKNLNKNIDRIEFPQKLNEILVENSKYSSSNHLKNRLIKEGILEYKCAECGIKNIWNNKPISLHLDHINGINNDNRINNLRILCPNCHSQTATYAGKRNKIKNFCSNCKTPIHKNSTLCVKCSNIKTNNKNMKFQVSKEELINLIQKYPMTKIGTLFGVSDNAIRKRCKALNIDYKNVSR